MKSSKLRPGERPLLVENHPDLRFFERNPPLFVGGKQNYVPIFHLSPLQIEVLCRSRAGMMIPPVGEQDTADIHEQRRYRDRFFI